MNVAVCPEHLNILSICTGGGGLDLGIELAVPSARSVCMVEREAYAVAQLVSAMEAGHLAPAPIWSDARTFNGRAWRGAVDGLIGGIPCQPHSLAGRKGGSNDPRDLWSNARRIIVQSRAWFVVIENVGGMLSAGDDEVAGAQRVWRDLSKLGFEVEGGLFTAAEVGAPHQRERIFILAVADPSREQRRARRDAPRGTGGAYSQPAGPGAGFPGVVQADAISGRRATGRDDHGSDVRNEPHAAGQHAVEHAESIRRGEGRTKPELWRGRDAVASADGPMAYAYGNEPSPIGRDPGKVRCLPEAKCQPKHSASVFGGGGDTSLFPPGPNDLERWRDILTRAPELEPAFRRVADGLASRLDIARVDRLRLLGNGVVSLEGAYAFRTLVTRLAARGSAGAAHIVRMMEGIDA